MIRSLDGSQIYLILENPSDIDGITNSKFHLSTTTLPHAFSKNRGRLIDTLLCHEIRGATARLL